MYEPCYSRLQQYCKQGRDRERDTNSKHGPRDLLVQVKHHLVVIQGIERSSKDSQSKKCPEHFQSRNDSKGIVRQQGEIQHQDDGDYRVNFFHIQLEIFGRK